TQDAFSRSGWLWPVDAKGEPLKATSYMAVGFYVAKYVNKKSDMDLAAKGLGAKEWNNSLKTKLSLLPKKLFRIRMSRNFGMKMLTMTNLSTECLIQLSMQGVEFDNGDMYVDGHKAASDVRDEFVSVTEKLMDELAQCYNVLPQLDINN